MLVLALVASAAVALPAPVLEQPSAAAVATAPAVIPDSTLAGPRAHRVLALAAAGGTVTAFCTSLLPLSQIRRLTPPSVLASE